MAVPRALALSRGPVTAGSVPPLIITAIETLPLRIPFKPGPSSVASARGPAHTPAVDSLLVKVTTDEGIVGWGEGFGFEATPLTQRAIDDLIAPLCVGQDATRIAPLMREVQERLQVFGRAGTLIHALSAVDIALWDIAGKAAGAPLHRLLGGAAAADLACYASLDAFSDPALARIGVREPLEAGFKSVKLHEKELPAVRASRQEAGHDVELMLDVNCAWTVSQARERVSELSEVRLKWLEEPIWPPENYDGLAQLRRTEGIPIAAGENASTLMEFDRLMRAGAVDFVQPSPAKMGGVTELCKVFSSAALHDVTVMPHSFYNGPGLLAAIHVTAALGAVDSMIEWRYFAPDARTYGDALVANDGRVQVPQGPGLGIDPDPDVIRAYRRT